MATFWERAAHSVYRMLSLYFDLFGFEGGTLVLIATIPGHCLSLLFLNTKTNNQAPVVQSIVSLTTSLRGHLVKYIPTTLSNTLLFLLAKCENLLHFKRFSHFSNKN